MNSFSVEEHNRSRRTLTVRTEAKQGFTRLIVVVCIFNILLKASYSVCAPFLPAEANKKGVDQSLIGALFCSYSVSFAIVSPLVGKFMSKFGRRNFLIFGASIIAISNLGFVILHFMEGANVFIFWFTFLRLLQGVGTGCLQTANYSILSLMYPTQIGFVCGCLEAAAGIGMCFGPIFAIPFYQLGGYTAPFLVFAGIFFIYCFMINSTVPAEVDDLEDEVIDTSKYSYFKMISNKRILFANCALLVNIFQYTFIDPFLANRMLVDFNLGEKSASLLFFVLGVGYAGACQGVHLTLNYFTFRRCFFTFFILNGLCTLMYGPTEMLPIPKSLFIIAVFMFFGGITSAHTIIPTLPEILEAGRTELHYPPEVLNDFSSGLFNMSFAFGEIFGPLIGNYMYVSIGMAATCDYIGIAVVLFAIIYYLNCDVSMPWNKQKQVTYLIEDSFMEELHESKLNNL